MSASLHRIEIFPCAQHDGTQWAHNIHSVLAALRSGFFAGGSESGEGGLPLLEGKAKRHGVGNAEALFE
jgi:hypothetical protein